jgi:hypothetical protein
LNLKFILDHPPIEGDAALGAFVVLELVVNVGEYLLEPGLILTTSKEGEQLFRQVPGE